MIERLKTWFHLAWVTIMLSALGCADATSTAAAASYGSALDECIVQGDSGPAIDACRARVDQAWGIDSGITVTVSSKDASHE